MLTVALIVSWVVLNLIILRFFAVSSIDKRDSGIETEKTKHS